MNVHTLFALSSTAVVVAACSGGGSSAPHAALQSPASPATTGPVALGHAANSTLTIKATPNLVHLTAKGRRPAKTGKAARRRPAFIDAAPGDENYVEVEVTNLASNGTVTRYMAAVDVPVVGSQTNAQTIPIYLAPGQDTVLVQEAGIYGGSGGLQNNTGYLLAQGSTAEPLSVGENAGQTLSITMQMAVYDLFVGTNLASAYSYVFMTSANAFTAPATDEGAFGGYHPTLCLDDNANVYFLPGDILDDVYVFNTNPGNVAPQSIGIPSIGITSSTTSGANSYLKPNAFGGYIASFDSNEDPIFVTATATAVSAANEAYGPIDFASGGLLSPQPTQTITDYANIEQKGSYDCEHNYLY
jgi:hypothetical protein